MPKAARNGWAGIVLLLGLVSLADAAEEFRTWTDASGKFRIRAKLIALQDDVAKLRREDGKETSIPRGKLSREDQDYLNSRHPFREPPAENPPPEKPPEKPAEPSAALDPPPPSKPEPPPMAVPNASLREDALGGCAVVVSQTRREPFVRPGYVLASRGNSALVLAAPYAGGETSVQVRTAGGDKLLPATLWFLAPELRVALYRVAAAGAPARLPAPAEAKIGQKVRLVRLAGGSPDKMTFAEVEAEVAKLFRNFDGELKQIEFSLPVLGVAPALAVDSTGAPVAIFPHPLKAGIETPLAPKGKVVGEPLAAYLANLNRPRLQRLFLEPVGGDGNQVEFALMATVLDPIGELTGVGAWARRLGRDESKQPFQRPPGLEATTRDETLRDHVPLELVAGSINQETGEATYRGVYRFPHPGQLDVDVAAQIVFSRAAGELLSSPRGLQWRLPRNAGGTAKPSPIFGPTGRPQDVPNPTPHPGGGYLLTSAATRFPSLPPPPKTTWLEPEKASEAIGGSTAIDKTVRRELLRLVPTYNPVHDGSKLAASPARDFIYVFGENSWLNKVDTREWIVRKRVRIGQPVSDLACGPKYLLAALPQAEALLVLDADTLLVERVIPAPAIQNVAASPTGSIAYYAAFGTGGDRPIWSGPALCSVDVATGRSLHRLAIDSAVARQRFEILCGSEAILASFVKRMRFSPDGTRLYCATTHIDRFRIENEDLVYEARVTTAESQVAGRFVLSGDGKQVAVPMKLLEFSYFDALKPKQRPIFFRRPASGVLDYDAEGKLWLARGGAVEKLDWVGSAVETWPSPSPFPAGVLTLPDNRVLVWSSQDMYVLRSAPQP